MYTHRQSDTHRQAHTSTHKQTNTPNTYTHTLDCQLMYVRIASLPVNSLVQFLARQPLLSDFLPLPPIESPLPSFLSHFLPLFLALYLNQGKITMAQISRIALFPSINHLLSHKVGSEWASGQMSAAECASGQTNEPSGVQERIWKQRKWPYEQMGSRMKSLQLL